MRFITTIFFVCFYFENAGTWHSNRGATQITCTDNTYPPTGHPTTAAPTTRYPTSNPQIPTKPPTNKPWNQCNGRGSTRKKCKYQVQVDVTITFKYNTNDDLDKTTMETIIVLSIDGKYIDSVDDEDNMDITITIIDNGDGTGSIGITVMIGVEDDDMYSDHFTENGDNGSLRTDVAQALTNDASSINNAFVIGETTSEFELLEQFETTEPTENEGDKGGLLDFATYGTVDWVLLIIILLVIAGICIIAGWCILKKRKKTPTSKLGVSTSLALTNVELFGENKTQPRPAASISFGSDKEAPKQQSVAFDAAIAGVALTKQETNIDLSYVLIHAIHIYLITIELMLY